jgi:alpha-1,6-mannosyltransferase
MPVWHATGLVVTVLVVLFIWLRLRPGPIYALGLSLGAVAVFGPAIRPWYALWGLFLIAAAAPNGSVRHRVAAASAVLALAVLPSGGPPDVDQVVLAVSGGALALVVLWQARQAARTEEPAQPPVLGRTA